MLVGRFNRLLCCVKKTKGQNFVCAEGQHAQLTFFSRAFEVKKRENIDLSTTSSVINISLYLTKSLCIRYSSWQPLLTLKN